MRDGFRTFWRGPLRTPVLVGLTVLVATTLAFSLRRLTQVEGRLVRAGGEGVEGAEVVTTWYVRRAEAFENLGRPLAQAFGNSLDVSVEEQVLRRVRTRTARDGSYRLPGSLALVWPGAKGPFVRVRFRAADALSGRPYAVREFRAADGTEYPGAIDTGTGSGTRDLAGLLARLELPPPGRIRDIAVDGERVATAEGTAGVRLYRVKPGGPPELVAHRTPQGSEIARSVGFAGETLAAFRSHGFDLLETGDDLVPRASQEGLYERLLAASGSRLGVLAEDSVELFESGTALERKDRLLLSDPGRDRDEQGPERVRMYGSALFYQVSDGTVRLLDVDSSFRTPATLTDPGGPVVGFSYLPATGVLVLASSTGASVYDVSRPESTRRLGRFELAVDPIAVVDHVVVGSKGVAVLALEGASSSILRTVPLTLGEVEASSATRVGGALVIPILDDVRTRIVTVGKRWDTVLGSNVEKSRKLRDSARLAGARILDLGSGVVREVRLAAPARVLLREDGFNRSLVQALMADGTTLLASDDDRLLAFRFLALP